MVPRNTGNNVVITQTYDRKMFAVRYIPIFGIAFACEGQHLTLLDQRRKLGKKMQQPSLGLGIAPRFKDRQPLILDSQNVSIKTSVGSHLNQRLRNDIAVCTWEDRDCNAFRGQKLAFWIGLHVLVRILRYKQRCSQAERPERTLLIYQVQEKSYYKE